MVVSVPKIPNTIGARLIFIALVKVEEETSLFRFECHSATFDYEKIGRPLMAKSLDFLFLNARSFILWTDAFYYGGTPSFSGIKGHLFGPSAHRRLFQLIIGTTLYHHSGGRCKGSIWLKEFKRIE